MNKNGSFSTIVVAWQANTLSLEIVGKSAKALTMITDYWSTCCFFYVYKSHVSWCSARDWE
jgi:hypothetical protein